MSDLNPLFEPKISSVMSSMIHVLADYLRNIRAHKKVNKLVGIRYLQGAT
jgi:hypothetical protein